MPITFITKTAKVLEENKNEPAEEMPSAGSTSEEKLFAGREYEVASAAEIDALFN